METSNSLINPISIVNILTLRYDTTISPNIPKKTWNDFKSIKKSPTSKTIEDSN